MKKLLTYRMIALLTLSLVFAPIMNFSAAQTMLDSAATQSQSDAASSKCHENSKDHKCHHCSAPAESSCCNGNTGGQCDNTCNHCVVSMAISTEFLSHLYSQPSQNGVLQTFILTLNLDTHLRPPQFA